MTMPRYSKECEATSPQKSADEPGHPPPIFPQRNLTIDDTHLFFFKMETSFYLSKFYRNLGTFTEISKLINKK